MINARRHQDFTDRQHPDIRLSRGDHVGHIGAAWLHLDADLIRNAKPRKKPFLSQMPLVLPGSAIFWPLSWSV